MIELHLDLATLKFRRLYANEYGIMDFVMEKLGVDENLASCYTFHFVRFLIGEANLTDIAWVLIFADVTRELLMKKTKIIYEE